MRVSLFQFDGMTPLRSPPLAAGMLAASVADDPELRGVELTLETARRELRKAIAAVDRPDVVALSTYAWNIRYSLAVAQALEQRFPAARIVVGGPSVPRRREAAEAFWRDHPFIDVMAFGEGELTFREILRALERGEPLDGVDGIAFADGAQLRFTPARPRMTDLRAVASPYLAGTFDELLEARADLRVSALVETNRGCPFACTFCDWGQAINSRVHELPLERVLAELKWIVERGIPYLYIVDANFGIRPRDQTIVDAICELKRTTGLPEYVHFHLTKNAHRKNLRTVEALRAASIGCQVALSMQDFDAEVLRAIKRDNISLPKSLELRQICAEQHIPTFNELLLGLPRQTLASFRQSVIAALTPFPSDTFFLYLVRLLDNAEMASPEHRTQFALETRLCRVVGHDAAPDHVPEYEEIVVGSASLSVDDWRRGYAFGHIVAACHNLWLLDVVLRWLRRQLTLDVWFDALLDAVDTAPEASVLARWRVEMDRFSASILAGGPLLLPVDVPGVAPRRQHEPAEALAIVALADFDRFLDEVAAVARGMCGPSVELDEVFRVQRLLTPAPGEHGVRRAQLERDWSAFVNHHAASPPLPIGTTTLVCALPKRGRAFYESYLRMAYSKIGRPTITATG